MLSDVTTPNGHTRFATIGLLLRAAGWAALLAGSLDLLYNFVFWGWRGVTPAYILRFIASGLLGQHSFELGWVSAAMGAFAHYGILAIASILYMLAFARSAVLRDQWLAGGLAYGGAIFLVMRYVVVPLSAAPPYRPSPVSMLVLNISVHLFLVGLPIGWIAHRRMR